MKKIIKKTPSKNITINSTVDLEEKALDKFNAGLYREAIEYYKTLLKQKNNPDWQKKLADCYLQRALGLAAKGMTKEATVLWENYTQNAKPPYHALDSYIIWQLQNNNTAKIKASLSQLSAQQLDEDYTELAALLGMLMLSGYPELVKLLPQESQLLKYFDITQAAIDAYRMNAAAAMDTALAKLPFRSAFRDFRTLLKAVLLLPVSIEQAEKVLIKIPDTSPYYFLVSLLQLLPMQGADLVNRLLTLEPKQRKLIAALKGFSKKQEELLNNLSQQKELTDKAKFGVAIKYKDLFGIDLSERFCQATLAVYPGGQKDFAKNFNTADSFEIKRFKALNAERKDDTYAAEEYWLEAVDILKTRNDSESAFKIALILRHIAKFYPPDDPEWWIKSLEYDPDDCETYLKVIRIFAQISLNNVYFKEWLDKGLAKFPDNLDFLMLAIQEALNKNAFKKAVQYAKNILKIDPVNTSAKQTLFCCHLAHARKMLNSKKFHLVENELNSAQNLSLGKRYQNQIELLRGFLVYLNEDQKQGLKLMSDAVQKIDNCPVNALFIIAMEALLLKQPLAPLKAIVTVPKKYLLSSQELTRLIEFILHYVKEDDFNRTNTLKALANISNILKVSAKEQAYTEDELLVFCQCLETIKYFELLQHCAKIAQAKWDKPIWMYYQVYAAAKGDAKNCSKTAIKPLEDYLERHGRAKHSERATQLIGSFVDNYYRSHSPVINLKGLMGSQYDDDYMEDPIEDLFEHLSSDVVKKINVKMDVMTKKMNPTTLLISLIEYLPQNKKTRDIATQNPDIFTVLLFMKAAEELGINTQVSIEEVLDYFSFDEPKMPSFLPFF